MDNKYLFSVVVPVCHAGEGLAETIDSLTRQDLGFSEHIQIILVNAGGTEDGETVCRDYQKCYPENIVCVTPEGAGVSAARNHAMNYVEGRYVNFLDAGGIWTENSFRAVYEFFEKRYDQTDLVACPEEYAGAGDEYKWLNKKYEKGSRVIDVLQQYSLPQMHVTAAFVKAEALVEHRFDGNLTCMEDSRFVNSVILDRLKYGVVAEARKTGQRKDSVSSIRNQGMPKEWYLDTPRRYYMELVQESIRKYGTVVLYIQYLILCDFQRRLREDVSRILTEEEQAQYVESLKEMLAYMDDDLICHQINTEYKIYALSLKYGRDIREELKYRKGNFYFHNVKIYRFHSKSLFSVDVLVIKDGMLRLSGRIWCPFAEETDFYFRNDRGEKFPVVSRPAGFRKAVILGKEIMRVRGYEAELPLEEVRSYCVYGVYRNHYPQKLYIRTGKFSHLSHDVEELYYHDGGYLLSYQEDEAEIRVRRKHFFPHLGKELRLLCRCVRDKQYEIVWYRLLYHLVKPFLRKERWIVMERIHVAGDNAEHFYRFLEDHAGRDVKAFFTIASDSEDYEKMKQVGKVLPFRGFRHKLNVLLAGKIISSQGEDNIFNPWDTSSVYIRDLYKYKFVFLQHGIIKDDLSEWLNKFNKNLHMFVTSAKPEYESILSGDYFYGKSVVKLTGLPRYDNLNRDIMPEKSIIFMPTWRFSLASPLDNDTGERAYNPRFRKSLFFQFYQKLIQDERLIAALKQHGYTGKFFLHTHHRVQRKDFEDNDTIRLLPDGIDYQEEFQKNALLITDFSSVAFDFAYLKKPVIYTQFDIGTFFQGQVYSEGYFDYERDGLGPVCYDYETTVQTIIGYVERGCQLEREYDERGDRFYRWFDRGNCQRVYDEIRGLDESGLKADFSSLGDLSVRKNRFCASGSSRTRLGRTLPCQKETGQQEQVVEGTSDQTFTEMLNGCQKVIDRVKERHGEIPPFFQNLLIQHLCPMFLTEKTCRDMGTDEDQLRKICKQLDDDMICGCRCVPEDVAVKLLSLKYGRDVRRDFAYRDGKLKFDNLTVVPLKEVPFQVEGIRCKDGMWQFRGTVMLPLGEEGIHYYCADNRNKQYEIEWEDGEELFFLGERMRTRKKFTVQLKAGEKKTGMRFMYRYKGTGGDRNTYHARIRMVFSPELGMEEGTRRDVMIFNRHLLKIEKRVLSLEPLRFKTKLKLFFTFPWKSIKMVLCGR